MGPESRARCSAAQEDFVNDSIYWLHEVNIQPRQLEEFRALMKTMVRLHHAGEPDEL